MASNEEGHSTGAELSVGCRQWCRVPSFSSLGFLLSTSPHREVRSCAVDDVKASTQFS